MYSVDTWSQIALNAKLFVEFEVKVGSRLMLIATQLSSLTTIVVALSRIAASAEHQPIVGKSAKKK